MMTNGVTLRRYPDRARAAGHSSEPTIKNNQFAEKNRPVTISDELVNGENHQSVDCAKFTHEFCKLISANDASNVPRLQKQKLILFREACQSGEPISLTSKLKTLPTSHILQNTTKAS